MTESEWQEVYSIVRKYHRALLTTSNHTEEHDRIAVILDKLNTIAYPEE